MDDTVAISSPLTPLKKIYKGGRISEKQLFEVSAAYFERCKDEKKPFNLHQLAHLFGLTIKEFREGKDIVRSRRAKNILKRAQLACEADLSSRLSSGGNSINLIFYAKNVFGWQDKSETSVNLGINVRRINYSRPANPKKREGD